ncbi:MAG TPA: nuclear transport factor 2 family protein [Bacteroidia bacterium]|nr:nuclear transport factor 2 family protein [Bacteroidia bacterium]
MNNSELITKFYQSFANKDAEGMVSCYHDEIQFQDPAFGLLKGDDAKKMWRMLMKRSKGEIEITFGNVQADEKTGKANWKAEYVFSQTGRKVVNVISAQFEFRDGKIFRHKDHFSMWKWSRQALGLPGLLLGWSGFMKKKIQERSRKLLENF